MNNQDEILKKILKTYAADYFPALKMRVRDIKVVDGRYYLVHDECSVIISLLPPIKNEDHIGTKT